jgi:hypothetical protein
LLISAETKSLLTVPELDFVLQKGGVMQGRDRSGRPRPNRKTKKHPTTTKNPSYLTRGGGGGVLLV